MKKFGFYLLLIIVCLFCLGPMLWQMITSIKPYSELTTLPPIFPSKPIGTNYISVFKLHPFLTIIRNSVIVATVTTIFSLILGSFAAFALAKMKVPRKNLILLLILSASMFPPIATVSPLYMFFRALQLRDSLLSLIITYTTFSLPLTIWVLTNFFETVPDEIYKASRVDGCTTFQSLYKVLLPLVMPGISATAILVFIFAWNEFLYALTFTSTVSSRTIPVGIALFPGMHEVPWGEIAAASVIVTIPLVALVFAFQRRIIEGLTAGAVKG
jgi:multiple sugar transport system permease protein